MFQLIIWNCYILLTFILFIINRGENKVIYYQISCLLIKINGISDYKHFSNRYSTSGLPQECRLLDLQIISRASVAMDLQHFLLPSLGGKLRKEYLPHFLTHYYANYASVLAGTNLPVKFSLTQLTKEFHDKLLYGFIMSLTFVPAVLLKPEDVPKFEELFANEGIDKDRMIEHQTKVNNTIRASPNYRIRLLDMFDELRGYGFFKNSAVSRLVRTYSQNN